VHSWQLAVQCLCERIATVDAATANQSPSSAKPKGETLARARFDWAEVLDEPFTGGPRLPRT
jgi:hypothetical protein